MTDTQVEYAGVILASGRDLLGLLNSILDLAKVESGTATRRDGRRLASGSCTTISMREFDHVARSKGLDFGIAVSVDVPGDDRHRPATAAPDPEEPHRERVQVHRARRRATRGRHGRRRLEPRDDDARERAPSVIVVLGARHRHRDRGRRSSAASSRPSRRATAPPPGSTAAPGSVCRSAASSSAARRRDHTCRSTPRQRQHVHGLPAARQDPPRPDEPRRHE